MAKNPSRVPVIWTHSPAFLNGRTVRRGDEISVSRQTARVYKALGRATDKPAQVAEIAQPVTQQPEQGETLTLDALRARYEAATGAAPDRRWGAARLRNELAGGPRYERRDMRAGE